MIICSESKSLHSENLGFHDRNLNSELVLVAAIFGVVGIRRYPEGYRVTAYRGPIVASDDKAIETEPPPRGRTRLSDSNL